MPRPPVGPTESLSDALYGLQRATRWTQVAFAERLGISTKTLRRYMDETAFPPVARHHAMVHALKDLDPAWVLPLVRSLGLTDDVAQVLARPVLSADQAVARRVVGDAVSEAAEHVDAGPGRTRLALLTFLERLEAAHVDLAAAKSALVATQAEKNAAKKGVGRA